MDNENKGCGCLILIAAAVLVVIGFFAFGGYSSYSKQHTVTATVCSKESVTTNSKGGHEYRVYTTTGTYKVTDHIVNGARFTSADTYGAIVPNDTYQITYYGWRIGWLSEFPNIVSVKLAHSNSAQTAANLCANGVG